MSGHTAGDTWPPIAGQCLDGAVPVSLAGITAATAHIKRPDGTIISRPIVPAVDQVADKGKWTFPLIVGDLTVANKKWKMEVEVEFGAGQRQTFGPAYFPVKPALA